MKIDPNQLERLAAVMRRRRIPLRLKRLEREGLIRDAGRGWFEVPDVRGLPDYVAERICAMRDDHGRYSVRFEGHGPDDDDD